MWYYDTESGREVALNTFVPPFYYSFFSVDMVLQGGPYGSKFGTSPGWGPTGGSQWGPNGGPAGNQW
jgi:hypothetical protein